MPEVGERIGRCGEVIREIRVGSALRLYFRVVLFLIN